MVQTYTGTLTVLSCCHKTCEVVFAFDSSFEAKRRNDHAWFYCPNGHSQHYSGQSDKEKLTTQLEATKRQLEWANTAKKAAQDQAQAAERRRAAAQGQVTKIKKRVANGVCPCCNRHFVDLHRHMSGQHPNYVPVPDDQG